MTMLSHTNRLDISNRARSSRKALPFIRGSIQDLSDVDELNRHAYALGAAPLVHQARPVGDTMYSVGASLALRPFCPSLRPSFIVEHGRTIPLAAIKTQQRDSLSSDDFGPELVCSTNRA